MSDCTIPAGNPAEKTVSFQCVSPGAQNVFLVGRFNSWDIAATPMQEDQPGEWRVELALPPGQYEYKFFVDGVWCCQPGTHDEDYFGFDAVPNSFGSKNRVIQVEQAAAQSC
jgi:1,4-alpha-glucan branching enzyme